MLSTPQGAGAVGANSTLYFKVSDIGTTHSALVARGAANEREPQLTAKMPDHELWIGFLGYCVFDAGNTQLVVESVPPDAPEEDQVLVGRFTGLSFAVADRRYACSIAIAAIVRLRAAARSHPL